MQRISLRKIRLNDSKYFQKWWRDADLIALTSGNLDPITDQEVGKYLFNMIDSKTDYHFMINLNQQTIGHISLNKRRGDSHETQIIIGNKKHWGKGYGVKAIKLLPAKAKRLDIHKIYLEVRPENVRAIKAYEKAGFLVQGIKKYPKNSNQPETVKMIHRYI